MLTSWGLVWFFLKQLSMSFLYRTTVLGKLNNFVREWISELAESKVRIFFFLSKQLKPFHLKAALLGSVLKFNF